MQVSKVVTTRVRILTLGYDLTRRWRRRRWTCLGVNIQLVLFCMYLYCLITYETYIITKRYLKKYRISNLTQKWHSIMVTTPVKERNRLCLALSSFYFVRVRFKSPLLNVHYNQSETDNKKPKAKRSFSLFINCPPFYFVNLLSSWRD